MVERRRKPQKRSGSPRGTLGRAEAARQGEVSAKTAVELQEVLHRIRPLELVMLTRDRIEETLRDAVERGRMTAADAEELASGLVHRGREQTDDVLGDFEALLGRGREEIDGRTSGAAKVGTDAARKARRQVGGAARGARSRAAAVVDPALAQADRVRRAAGVGSSFPVRNYGELTAAQVQSRLSALAAPELRRVRDYERRNANRKSVLTAIERQLGHA